MKIKYETKKNWTEAIFIGNTEFIIFNRITSILQNDFNIIFTKIINGIDTEYWDFDYEGSQLVVHYNNYIGTTIYPSVFDKATTIDNLKPEKITELILHKLNE